jgi:hypothetical protein
MRLTVEPQLASWDAAASASQQRLGLFLTHVEAVAAPMMAGAQGRLAVELTVGLAACASLTSGGRDLDNYLYPLAKASARASSRQYSAARCTGPRG